MSRVTYRVTLPAEEDRKKVLLAARQFHNSLLTRPGASPPTTGLQGEHTRKDGRLYFEIAFSTRKHLEELAAEVGASVEEVSGQPAPEECLSCGNIADEPTAVCPNCRFREIEPCPYCEHEIPRTATSSWRAGCSDVPTAGIMSCYRSTILSETRTEATTNQLSW